MHNGYWLSSSMSLHNTKLQNTILNNEMNMTCPSPTAVSAKWSDPAVLSSTSSVDIPLQTIWYWTTQRNLYVTKVSSLKDLCLSTKIIYWRQIYNYNKVFTTDLNI